jgi:phosphatidate cytidylyltransferase
LKTIFIRALSGATYVGLVIGSLFLHPFAFAMVLLFFNLVALIEFQKFLPFVKPDILFVFTGSAAFILAHFILAGWISDKWFYLLLLLPLLITTAALYEKERNPLENISSGVFGILYITLPLSLLNGINLNHSGDFAYLVLCIFLLIWTNDTFAYLSGLSFGKHKLFERISPKKTWEGFFGGFVAVLVVAWFIFPLLKEMGRIEWIILAAIISISSVFGDFAESLFKRAANLKDSGNIMPGHGGILDRIDSLLFVAPVVYIYLQLIK